MRTKKHVLSIAGFDPSAGAGILSDIKTFEAHNVSGLGVCTCITYQNELKISGLSWVSADEIIEQLKPLFDQYHIAEIKIGLLQNLKTLERVVDYLLKNNPDARIIWDPILRSSSGFVFHMDLDHDHLKDLCRKLFLITPNSDEIKHLIPHLAENEASAYLSESCPVLLKGGHNENERCIDQLFENGKVLKIESQRLESEKHGTGCVLSSAIASNLANDMSLYVACVEAKQYVFKFLQSDPGLLGQHSYENAKIYS